MTGTWPWHWWTDELTEHLTIAWPGRRHPALSRRDRRRRTQSDTAHGRVANCQVIVTRVSSKSESAVRQTVILAGGQGTRLRPYTDDRPKPLIEIGGRPILEHQMRWLAAGGIEQVVVSCGYRADVLRSWVDARELPVTVSVVVEDEPLGRGGGLKYAARALPFVGERWMGLNGDVLTRFPIETFAERHHAHQAATTIAVTPLKSPYGIVGVTDDDRIERFVEAPVLPHWINAGIYLFEPWVTARLPDLGDQEDSTFPELAREGTLAAYRIDGYWRSIDTAKDVGKASRELAKLGWDTELVVR